MQERQALFEAALSAERFAVLPRDVHQLIAPLVTAARCGYLASSNGLAETTDIQVDAHAVLDDSVRRIEPLSRTDCNFRPSQFLSFKAAALRVYDMTRRDETHPHGLPLDDEWPSARLIGRQTRYIGIVDYDSTIFDTEERTQIYRTNVDLEFLYGIDKHNNKWITLENGRVQTGFTLDNMTGLIPLLDCHPYLNVKWLSEWTYVVGFNRRPNPNCGAFIADTRTVGTTTIVENQLYGMSARKRITAHDGRIFSGSHTFSIDEYDLRASRWLSWCHVPDRFVTDVAFAESTDAPPARPGGPCRDGQLPR